MPIVASGEISLGGNVTATRSVACELGRSGTAQICMNESAVRTLAAKTTAASAISMSDFYNKSNSGLGLYCLGGYYTGAISSPANYKLIVAPNATGCASCIWKTVNTASGQADATCNANNGYWNTRIYQNTPTHPAGNWTATRSIDGFSDWYLPARTELFVLYTNKGSMPAGEGYTQENYWSSSECSSNYGFAHDFYNGTLNSITKNEAGFKLRAVRRVAF